MILNRTLGEILDALNNHDLFSDTGNAQELLISYESGRNKIKATTILYGMGHNEPAIISRTTHTFTEKELFDG